MIDGRIINYILSIASGIESIGEVIAGTNKEKQVIEIIKKNLEDHVDELWIEHVPVTSWREEVCVVETTNGSYPCAIHPPYQGVIDEEVGYDKIISMDLDKLENKGITKIDISDKIILIDIPRDPDDIATVAYILSRYSPRLIVIRDRGESLRRIVVLDNVVALYREARQLNIPVVHVGRGIGMIDKLVGSRIYAKSMRFKSYGYNFIAKLHKRYDKYIYITAHHDHWLSGGSDNIIGISIIIALSEILKDINIDNGIVLASFTAEEGFPENITSFYWLVGSRYHINRHVNELVDNTALAINIDVVYKEPLVASTPSTIVRNMITSYSKDILLEYDDIIFDSFSFSSIGIPSVTFNTFKKTLEEGVYHSNRDFVYNISTEVVWHTIKSIYLLINNYMASIRNNEFINVYNINVDVQSILQRVLPSELLLNIYRVHKMFNKLRERLERPKCMYFINLFNRIINTSYVDRDIGKKLGIREGTDLIKCNENIIPLPIGTEFKNSSECYRNINFNLELLAYILFKYY
ncbi:MAG: M28 family peptidase [Ignisphaera sp.]